MHLPCCPPGFSIVPWTVVVPAVDRMWWIGCGGSDVVDRMWWIGCGGSDVVDRMWWIGSCWGHGVESCPLVSVLRNLPMSSSISVNGVRYAYTLSGQGGVVVFLHGWMCNQEFWRL